MTRFLEDLYRDLQYGVRMLRSAPLVSIAVAVTLALGIGLDAGVFNVINGLMLRPRAGDNARNFAHLYAEYTEHNRPVLQYGGHLSYSAYRALKDDSHLLEQLAAWRTDSVLIEDDAARSLNMEVTCDFFAVYGLHSAKLGRLFRDDECSESADPRVAVLSEELWQLRFASDPQIIGKSIMLNRVPFTVVGITPLDYAGRLRGPGVWVPYTAQPLLTTTGSLFRLEDTPKLWVEGRLKPNHTRAELAAELNILAPRLRMPQREMTANLLVTSGALIEDPNVRVFAFWIMLLVIAGPTLLLLVSCANVAVLLLSRAAARKREIAIRISVGAARSRILRQLVAEVLLLAAVAVTAGMYLALRIPHMFRAMIPAMPHYAFGMDWHVAAFIGGTALSAAFLAGLAPAAECLRQDVWSSLKGKVVGFSAGRSRWSVRDVLVIVQVGLSVVLMSASAIFIRAELDLIGSDPGFETRQVLQAPVQLPAERYGASDARRYHAELQQRIAALPAVIAVATASTTPLATDPEQAQAPLEFRLPGQAEHQGHSATLRTVSANYFDAIGVPILLGSGFSSSPGDASAAIVSQAFAAAFWPNQDPIGKAIIAPGDEKLRVIAVARDTRTERVGAPDAPCIYRARPEPAPGDLVLVRFRGDAASLEDSVKQIVHGIDPQTFVLTTTLRAALNDEAEAFWTIGKMLLTLALVAAGLALLGIYGVVGYMVTTRTRELGVRAALGATRGNLMRLVFAGGTRPVAVGIVAGLVMAMAASVGIAKALEDAPVAISAADPRAFVAVCALLLTSAVAAMLGHALRAARVEPIVALREE